MFEKLTKPGRKKGIFAAIVFGMISLVFVFFGVTPGPTGGVGGAAAVVNNEVISLADFRNRLQRLENEFRGIQNLPAAQRQEQVQRMRARAMEDLIDRAVIAQSAHQAGVWVPDMQVRETIIGIPLFQEEGRFQKARYRGYLEANQISPAEFELQMKREIALNRMRRLIMAGMTPNPLEVEQQNAARQTKVNLEFVNLGKSNVQKSMPIDRAALTAFLKDPANLAKAKEYYEANPVDFTEKEEVRARHILTRFDSGNKASEDEALEKIKGAEKRLEKEDFAKVAKELSEDPGSKDKGGDLGYFVRSGMIKEFSDAAFAAKPGTVVGPIRTLFGYHLIKVEDHKKGGLKSFDDVKNDIARILIIDERYKTGMEALNKALQDKDDKAVEQGLKAFNLKWSQTGVFSLSAPSVPQFIDGENVLNVALSLKKPGQMAYEIVRSQDTDYLVRLKSIERKPEAEDKKAAPGGALDFNEQQMLALRRANDVFINWVTEAKKRARIHRNGSLLQ